MQAIIMAAGKGSRLGELTGGLPKSFLEIKGKKLIEYNLDILDNLGVDEIIIVTGFMRDEFINLLKDRKNVKIIYNPFYELVNVIGSFYIGMNELHDDFLYLHADTLCDPYIFGELAKFKSDINLPIDYKICDDEAMKVRELDGEIVEITKKMNIKDAAGEFIGIASIKKNVISDLKKAVESVLEEKRFMEYFEAAIQKVMDSKLYSVKAVPMKDFFWSEIDFVEDYERAIETIPDYM